uniref:F-box domain-containing protein n=1 Tax=Leersia perrieri TaxID=77586 RepID=A0A0D9W6D4_9ORYZ
MSLSDLSGDVLRVILNNLDTRQAVRCSILSSRWRHVPGLLSNIDLDVNSFTPADDGFTSTLSDAARNNLEMVQAVQSLLAHESRHDIHRLKLRFFSRDESVGIIRAVDDAMARGRRILDLRFYVLSEKPFAGCPGRYMARLGKRFLYCFDTYPRVFAGLTGLRLEEFSDVVIACKNLIYLALVNCDFREETALMIQHEKLRGMNLDFLHL